MQQFKDKDWLRVIAGHERPINSVFQIKSCLTRYKLSDVELWQPKEGEWCWEKDYGLSLVISNDENGINCIVCFCLTSVFGKEFTTTLKDCEPFIGELPSFLKEHDEK